MPGFWTMATALMLVTVTICIVMERRRNNRTDVEKVGFMPWNHIMIVALVMAAFSAGLAIQELF